MISFIKNNILTICCLALVVLFGTAGEAAAAGASDLMSTAEGKAASVFRAVKKIIFVVGGFGLVALAFMAIFGKVDWKKFAALATGLAILAAAGAIVEYATGTQNLHGTQSLDDSFGNSAGAGGTVPSAQ